MPILAACFLFWASVFAAPQNSADLRSLYGEPESEGFAVRPNVVLTVEHGSDGLACKVGIRPRQSRFLEGAPPGGLTLPKAMSVEEVTAIVDDVVPPGTRGSESLGRMDFQSSCLESELTSYAHVRIDRVSDCNQKGRGVESVDIAFQPSHCPSASQKSSELRSRYGQPNAERFRVRPGIRLAVEYGSDGLACEMKIEPDETPLLFKTAEEILDEAIPPSGRGKLVNGGETRGGWGMIEWREYENVTIGLSGTVCPPLLPNDCREQVQSAGATFKRATCQKPPF